MNEYIDVRGPNPVYFNGFISCELPNFARNTPLHVARLYWLEKAGKDYVYSV